MGCILLRSGFGTTGVCVVGDTLIPRILRDSTFAAIVDISPRGGRRMPCRAAFVCVTEVQVCSSFCIIIRPYARFLRPLVPEAAPWHEGRRSLRVANVIVTRQYEYYFIVLYCALG